MVQEIRSLQKLAIFFQGLTLGAEGGGSLYAVLYGMSSCISTVLSYNTITSCSNSCTILEAGLMCAQFQRQSHVTAWKMGSSQVDPFYYTGGKHQPIT